MDNGRQLPSAHLQLLPDGLLILNASHSDAGRYRCLSVERSKTVNYTTIVAEYEVRIAITGSGKGLTTLPEAQRDGPSVLGLQAVVGLLVVFLLALLAWNFYNGHIPLPWKCGQKNGEQDQGVNSTAPRPAQAEEKPLVSGTGNSNNHNREEAAFSAAENDVLKVNLPCLQFPDESES